MHLRRRSLIRRVQITREDRWLEQEQGWYLIQTHGNYWGLGHYAWGNWGQASPGKGKQRKPNNRDFLGGCKSRKSVQEGN